MKIRNGFVSNSSSSSFIIQRSDLTASQLYAIEHHIEYANEHELDGGNHHEDDAWSITCDRDIIEGSTWMDNFSMSDVLDHLGVKNVKWRD